MALLNSYFVEYVIMIVAKGCLKATFELTTFMIMMMNAYAIDRVTAKPNAIGQLETVCCRYWEEDEQGTRKNL